MFQEEKFSIPAFWLNKTCFVKHSKKVSVSLQKIVLDLGAETTAVGKEPRAGPRCESDMGLGLGEAVRYPAC